MNKILPLIILGILTSLVTVISATTMDPSTSLLDEKFNKNTMGHSSIVLLDENFSGTFPPDGWSTDWWTQCNSSCAGSEPPCACLYCYNQGDANDSYITSKAVDASNYEKVNLRFAFGAEALYPNYCYIWVKYRTNETSPWKNITPWDNPIVMDFQNWFEVGIYLGGCGDALQINWTYKGYYYYCHHFCLDDVKIYSSINNPPDAPIIDGPKRGKPGIEYNYTFVAIDPNGDDVLYYIDLYSTGDGFWTGPYTSGEEIILPHTWPKCGTFTISAMAKDIFDAESNWTYFDVEIPRNKAVYNSLFQLFLDRFPNTFPIIRQILRLY